MNKKVLIIIVVIAIALIAVLFMTGKDKKVEYTLLKSNTNSENTLFKDYDTFKKFMKKTGITEETLTNKVTFKKDLISEIYTEEFFNEHNLALVALYEDTSREYIYSIDKVEYSSDKTQATISYTYKFDTYADMLSRTWYDYMFVALDKKVENVVFQRVKD